jgi:hemerythrin-like domain-containing protein
MNTTLEKVANRRGFLRKTGILLTNSVLACSVVQVARAEAPEKHEPKEGEKISPPEDLMREHGVLRRILLIYEDVYTRLNSGKEFPAEVLSSAADIIRRFIEEYHEKLEEDHLFPRFEKAGKLVELVTVLKEQHKAGRVLTQYIRKPTTEVALRDAGKRKELADKILLFMKMYRPHAAREDTVLFPVLRSIVSAQEFDSLGEEFEDQEDALFGEGGFEKVVAEVADLEKRLGIYEIAQFTPLE